MPVARWWDIARVRVVEQGLKVVAAKQPWCAQIVLVVVVGWWWGVVCVYVCVCVGGGVGGVGGAIWRQA